MSVFVVTRLPENAPTSSDECSEVYTGEEHDYRGKVQLALGQ